MKSQLTVSLLLFATAAGAQITTLDYTGATLFGYSTELRPGDLLSLDSVPFTGNLTAELVLDGTRATGYDLMSYHVSYATTGTYGGTFISLTHSSTEFSGPVRTIGLTFDQNNNVDGAVINFNDRVYHNDSDFINLGSSAGDSLHTIDGHEGSGWGCINLIQYPHPWAGGTIKNCEIVASNTKAGTWSVHTEAEAAPEIDPASAVSGLTLLFGGVAVLRGRRSKPGAECRMS